METVTKAMTHWGEVVTLVRAALGEGNLAE